MTHRRPPLSAAGELGALYLFLTDLVTMQHFCLSSGRRERS
ncbi:protein of unknown function (plasmid) [Cupriavidus taiwanensis]|uniref:Uncharacterized protein n=1 Tax=Cupriavidus taiwanensis TaxID=164546 RepID=A0A7Z7NQB9_9BURK|nr:protein of unknown function [Cupriavidus taiwanensis]SOZ12793.1 protein of unknown function [Cupriavidus taiwanensis]SOZ41285.1 protein of unknown function [Cupriavidus taiwanensis]SPC23555.1 protein of unknown function [Cupriavidus taiwanensis]SPD54842.1 protein of unknown function [Cupriavidus taiwanensis]